MKPINIVTVVCLMLSATARAFDDQRLAETRLESIVQSHCAVCHDDSQLPSGGLSLAGNEITEVLRDPEHVHQLLKVIGFREMPPADAEDLSDADRHIVLKELRQRLQTLTAGSDRQPETPLRRMNRFQYSNAVEDLLQLKVRIFALPEKMMRIHGDYFQPETGRMADVVKVGNRPLGKSQLIEPRLAGVAPFPQDLRAEHGFDNQADHLSLSPLLMESFLELGQSITESNDFGPSTVGIWNDFYAAPDGLVSREDLQERISRFLWNAFRRKPDSTTVDRYVDFIEHRMQRGDRFTDAMKAVTAAVISSPRFLYLFDGSASIDEQLASRLSFFLWGSLPDSVLLDLADQNKLNNSEQLRLQVTRMLRDRKVKRFCDSFPSQWLQLDRIISSVPNRKQFPRFYFSKYRDSMHMALEPLLIFETVLIENQSLLQLIDSDFTYRSALLEDAYGMLKTPGLPTNRKGNNVTALTFYRVPVEDRRNGGVITNAAVMTMTSGPERTQPITRGAWVANVVFGNAPKPPPADVPALDEHETDEEADMTLRERLAAHRERSDCRGCHEKIDPLGFALENYNPIGKWRDRYSNGRDIDMAGELFRRDRFTDVVEFKDSILNNKRQFVKAFAGHLMRFAMARQTTAYDERAIDEIADRCVDDNGRIHTLIEQVVLSAPFRR